MIGRLAHTLWFYAGMIGLILVGFGMLFFWPEPWRGGREAATAVAHALIIAGILGMVVDQFVKARFLREVTRDVYHYLIGYDLPIEIKEHIKELMRTKIVRSRFQVDYRFGRHDDDNLTAQVTLDYDVENYSNQTEPFTPELAVESIDNPTFRSVTLSGPKGANQYSLAQAELKVFSPEEGSLQVNGKKVKIPPRQQSEPYHVRWTYSILVPNGYSDAWAFVYPTIDVSFTADVPDGFEFHVSGAERIGNTWRLKYPRRGVRVRCFLKGSITAGAPA